MSSPEDTACRLCGGATAFAYKTTVLTKYEVSYYSCLQCCSLQTERPYWLPEAYGNIALSIDPGAARRVLHSYVLVDVIARLFGCHKLLDFGGSAGFLCRLLRDQRYDAYSFDQYVEPIYAPHFIGSPSDRYDLVSAFEVIEHFACPAQDLEQIFRPRPRLVLASTELFSGQSAAWWYLAPLEGQHVFFYSRQAAQFIATRYGYRLLVGPGFLLFSHVPITLLQREFIMRFLRPRVLRILGALLLMRGGRGAEADAALLSQRTARDFTS